ncbi:hypothetical protein EVAR_13735_1 [Eumeta japonica]|uniref:Uncharacterized protein n=1 Tax=Eumeta variegata TaxID=151549 RepID=A0A4C1UBP9_EUMVA|nr:hypothetical protein EVAR_13735_1 [Eumeta japonica]
MKYVAGVGWRAAGAGERGMRWPIKTERLFGYCIRTHKTSIFLVNPCRPVGILAYESISVLLDKRICKLGNAIALSARSARCAAKWRAVGAIVLLQYNHCNYALRSLEIIRKARFRHRCGFDLTIMAKIKLA